ncbi:nitrous oxide-stimulated promoter domain protein [Lachnoanaerobaculum saburreum F0468]|nr:nitrous oxide-stimulated promoter domain protein [Lachnoanaerobaculum saburreum F0468]
MRIKIKEVMKFSGPRIMLYHPIMCIKHVLTSLSAKFKKYGGL